MWLQFHPLSFVTIRQSDAVSILFSFVCFLDMPNRAEAAKGQVSPKNQSGPGDDGG